MTSGRTLSARGAERRADLLKAAVGIVAGAGSGALTHRSVAAAAGASLASVTYHFSSIEDLRRAMFERALETIDDQLTATAATGAPADLPRLAADYVVVLVTHHRSAALAVQEMIVAATHDHTLAPTFQRYHQRIGAMLAPCVGGQEPGLAVAAALQGLVLTALTYAEMDADRLHAGVLDLIERLRVAPAPET